MSDHVIWVGPHVADFFFFFFSRICGVSCYIERGEIHNENLKQELTFGTDFKIRSVSVSATRGLDFSIFIHLAATVIHWILPRQSGR